MGAVGLWFYRLSGFLYGFAHGVVSSRVAQFGGAAPVALAAGGVAGHDRAPVRVTAHALGWRLAAAFGGCLKSNPEVKDRAAGGACAASGLAPGRGGSRCLVAVLLVVALSRIPRRIVA